MKKRGIGTFLIIPLIMLSEVFCSVFFFNGAGKMVRKVAVGGS